MKKLFLTSSAYTSLHLIKNYLPQSLSPIKVAFIPTAADPYENKDFVQWDRDKLLSLGMVLTEIDLTKLQGEALEKALAGFPIIFVAGGNTFYLLDKMRQSGFDQLLPKLLVKGVIYIGSSAGSVVCGPTIEGVKEFDDPAAAPNLTDFTGLNLHDHLIFPHVQKEKYAVRLAKATSEMLAKGYKILKLTDEQILMIEDDEITLL